MELSQGLAVLAQAAYSCGLDMRGVEVIRNGSNLMCRLPNDGIVARVGQLASQESARREVAVSCWLIKQEVPTVKPVEGLPQPVVVEGYPITWWEFLPSHRSATPAELGATLRILHDLPYPTGLDIRKFDPFLQIRRQIGGPGTLSRDDLDWISRKLDRLHLEYSDIKQRSPSKLIHGDAWQGNVAVSTSGQPILLDLESASLGPPEWDLIPMAADYSDFARVSFTQYGEFVESYGGFDVTSWQPFRTMADIQELKWISFAFAQARESEPAEREARHRLACLRDNLPRPWKWTAL